MNITLYGPGTSAHQMVASTLHALLVKLKIPYTMEENNNIQDFVDRNISAVPAIAIDNDKILSIPVDDHFNKSLRTALTTIARKYKLGKMKNIIYPIDFTPEGKSGFDYAVALASDMKGSISLLHVCTPSTVTMAHELIQIEEAERIAKEQLTEFVVAYDDRASGDFEHFPLIISQMKVGFVSDAVCDLAQKDTDIIVLYQTPDDSIEKWLGSKSNDIIDQAKVPILLVPHTIDYKRFSKVGIAIENPEDLQGIIEDLALISDITKLEIELIHIVQPYMYSGASYFEEAIAASYLKQIKYREAVATTTIKGLEDVVVGADYDCLVIKHKNRSWWNSLFRKSTTKKLKNLNKMPLYVV